MILVRRSPSPYSRRCGLPPSPVCRIASQLRSSGVGRLIETEISTSPGAPPEGFTARFSIFGTACAGIARNGAATKRTAKTLVFMCSPPLWASPLAPLRLKLVLSHYSQAHAAWSWGGLRLQRDGEESVKTAAVANHHALLVLRFLRKDDAVDVAAAREEQRVAAFHDADHHEVGDRTRMGVIHLLH